MRIIIVAEICKTWYFGFSFHKKCFSNFANISKVERARKRYSHVIDTGEPSVVKRKAGRPYLIVAVVSNSWEGVGRSYLFFFFGKESFLHQTLILIYWSRLDFFRKLLIEPHPLILGRGEYLPHFVWNILLLVNTVYINITTYIYIYIYML